MFEDLRGKRVLITGSTAGMGLAAARLFARHGAKVGLNGRRVTPESQTAVDELNKLGGEAAFFQADLAKSDECERLIDAYTSHFGGLDVLINNAGGLGGRKGLESIDDALFDHVMNLNARSALMVTKYAISSTPISKRIWSNCKCDQYWLNRGSRRWWYWRRYVRCIKGLVARYSSQLGKRVH
ncbi:short-chain dehydrogenase/reductase SDR [Vibrio maritimus]|uniref:Short-chain dehydrogenase/reductase SDR n=1 Tax=Vibrio maritimus TaxID=990268 RepID=A0A090SM33_9VIBR|nr:short-chain dehydrogenase/reductase SDR [Vibrio maritimus]